VVRIIPPGVYEVATTRTQTLRPLLSASYLALASLLLLFLHLRFVPPDIRRGRWRGAAPTPAGPPTPSFPAPASASPPPVPSPPAAPAPMVAPVVAAPEPQGPPGAPGSGRAPFTPPNPPFDPRPDPPSYGSTPPGT
jgi:hypothetical protein